MRPISPQFEEILQSTSNHQDQVAVLGAGLAVLAAAIGRNASSDVIAAMQWRADQANRHATTEALAIVTRLEASNGVYVLSETDVNRLKHLLGNASGAA